MCLNGVRRSEWQKYDFNNDFLFTRVDIYEIVLKRTLQAESQPYVCINHTIPTPLNNKHMSIETERLNDETLS